MNEGNVRRLGNLIPMLLFVLFFVMCSGVLAAVFLRSAQLSADAGRRSDAVQLCRNQAERFRSGEVLPEGKQYYDENYAPAEPGNGVYLLEVTYSLQGTLNYAHIAVSSLQDEPLYALDVARFAPEGRLP